MFRKLFGKKNTNPKSNSSSTPKLEELIEKSTILILTHQLFMHHKVNNLVDDPNNPAWKNQAIYFWNGNEKFERKSLPPEFRNYPKHYFIVNQAPKDLLLNKGQAMPWFGMEGHGDKYFFSQDGIEIRLDVLAKNNIVQYVEMPTLTIENTAMLNDKENYFWLMNTELISYQNNNFQHNGKTISITKAVEMGGLQLIGLKRN